jgi:hypothetical protein
MQALRIARMTQRRSITSSQAQRAPHAHADQRRAPRYHHTTHTRELTHTTRQAPSRTTAPQLHGACHPEQRTPTSHAPHIAYSHAAYKNTSPTGPQDVPATATTARCANITAHRRAHATQSPVHSSALQTHRPQQITPSHTRGLHATLTSEISGCPASTGCCRRVGWIATTTTCRTHEQPSRHPMTPDAAADPSQPLATHLSASQSINQIKSNESQSARSTLSFTRNTVWK